MPLRECRSNTISIYVLKGYVLANIYTKVESLLQKKIKGQHSWEVDELVSRQLIETRIFCCI